VSEYTLTAQPALGGYQKNFDAVSLVELTELAIVSIAIPRGGEETLATALQDTFGADMPKPGTTCLSKDGDMRFLGMAIDQIFCVFNHPEPDAAAIVANNLKQAGYVTLQSDNWVSLRISGPGSRTALERICPIDLAPDSFTEGCVARTVMEHMGVIIYPDGQDSYVLISASSSAGSFLHAVETSIHNTLS